MWCAVMIQLIYKWGLNFSDRNRANERTSLTPEKQATFSSVYQYRYWTELKVPNVLLTENFIALHAAVDLDYWCFWNNAVLRVSLWFMWLSWVKKSQWKRISNQINFWYNRWHRLFHSVNSPLQPENILKNMKSFMLIKKRWIRCYTMVGKPVMFKRATA